MGEACSQQRSRKRLRFITFGKCVPRAAEAVTAHGLLKASTPAFSLRLTVRQVPISSPLTKEFYLVRIQLPYVEASPNSLDLPSGTALYAQLAYHGSKKEEQALPA
jgi:hypothetical protein